MKGIETSTICGFIFQLCRYRQTNAGENSLLVNRSLRYDRQYRAERLGDASSFLAALTCTFRTDDATMSSLPSTSIRCARIGTLVSWSRTRGERYLPGVSNRVSFESNGQRRRLALASSSFSGSESTRDFFRNSSFSSLERERSENSSFVSSSAASSSARPKAASYSRHPPPRRDNGARSASLPARQRPSPPTKMQQRKIEAMRAKYANPPREFTRGGPTTFEYNPSEHTDDEFGSASFDEYEAMVNFNPYSEDVLDVDGDQSPESAPQTGVSDHHSTVVLHEDNDLPRPDSSNLDLNPSSVPKRSSPLNTPRVAGDYIEKEAMESTLPTPPENQESHPVSKPLVSSRTPLSTRATPSFLEPVKTKVTTTNIASIDHNVNTLPSESFNGNTATTHLTHLSTQMNHLKSLIYQCNDGNEFNINSPKQVAKALFGKNQDGASTNKDVLEAMASAGNEMAAHIYRYRKLSREYKREEKRLEQERKGDIKNDYFGNLERRDRRINKRSNNNKSVTDLEATTGEVHNEATALQDSETAKSEPDSKLSTENCINEIIKESTTNQTTNRTTRREPLLLIDASAYIFRAYHALPPLHASDGTPVGALHGVCRMLQNLLLSPLLQGRRPRVVLAFDAKGTNFRHDIYPAYKANRGPCPLDLVPQFDLVREAADALGVVQVEAEGYEADDVIATLARWAVEEGVDVDILSGDKDLMQLITAPGIEPSVHMIEPMHFERVSHDDVIAKWGVSAEKLGDVLALAGDSSDNIPGVPGIGKKTAALLINEYGSLGTLLENANTIKQNKRRESLLQNTNEVQLFRKLVTLHESIPVEKLALLPSFRGMSDLRMDAFDPGRLVNFYERLGLNAVKTQLQKRLRSSMMEYQSPPKPEEYEGVPF